MLVPRRVIPKPECFWDFEGISLLFTIIWGNSQPAVGQVAMKFAQEFMNQDQKKTQRCFGNRFLLHFLLFSCRSTNLIFLSISRFLGGSRSCRFCATHVRCGNFWGCPTRCSSSLAIFSRYPIGTQWRGYSSGSFYLQYLGSFLRGVLKMVGT